MNWLFFFKHFLLRIATSKTQAYQNLFIFIFFKNTSWRKLIKKKLFERAGAKDFLHTGAFYPQNIHINNINNFSHDFTSSISHEINNKIENPSLCLCIDRCTWKELMYGRIFGSLKTMKCICDSNESHIIFDAKLNINKKKNLVWKPLALWNECYWYTPL